MTRFRSWMQRLRTSAGLGLLVLAVGLACSASLTGADTKNATAKPAKAAKKEPKKKLSGAELYALNCNRCHPERYPTEWTSAEWKTLMMHMRVRANLPAAQAKEILKYLQDESGN